ncbi:MAG: alpha/beta hydrolase [Chloroflexota bacterium]
MTRLSKWLIGTLIIILILGYVGYDLAQLQAGLEQPSIETLDTAAAQTQVNSPSPLITAYDSFSVSVEDGILIDVHMRENSLATANVLMIHGAGGGAWAWEAYFERFPETYNLYALSWRGHFTSSPVDDADAADYVQDQLAVLQAIDGRNALPIHVIGHSYGGATSVLATAQKIDQVASLHLVAPVVPLDYTLIQRQLVPRVIGPMMISANEQALKTAKEVENSGVDTQGGRPFSGMFVDQQQMERYWDLYAAKPYSVEKPGLLVRDGFAPEWQVLLNEAYAMVGEADLPVWFLIARYDNVVIPAAQVEKAQEIGAPFAQFESGHYIQLDNQVEESINYILSNLEP